jgi:gamma-glutamyl phosphate reductase
VISYFPFFVSLNTAKKAGRKLQNLLPEQRADILQGIAKSLKQNEGEIIRVNQQDLDKAASDGKLKIDLISTNVPND